MEFNYNNKYYNKDRYRKMDIGKEVMDWMSSQSSLSNKEKREIEEQYGSVDNMENDFFAFWEEVRAFSDQYQLSTRYVEEEFIIDGELIPVHLDYQDDEEYKQDLQFPDDQPFPESND